jgi:hypothetical protein
VTLLEEGLGGHGPVPEARLARATSSWETRSSRPTDIIGLAFPLRRREAIGISDVKSVFLFHGQAWLGPSRPRALIDLTTSTAWSMRTGERAPGTSPEPEQLAPPPEGSKGGESVP